MPLDLADFTEFQQNVFRIVSNIEPGRIITYMGIAEILGKPGAAQAVGSAVARILFPTFANPQGASKKGPWNMSKRGRLFKRKLLEHEGHDLSKLRGNYVCT